MRWRAWLSATPRPLEDEDDKRKKKPDERTRGQRMRESKHAAEKVGLECPVELGYFQHIADYLFEVGPTMGDQAVEWPNLEAWARLTGVDLDPFRARAIVTLSREFLGAAAKSRDPYCRLADLLED